MNRSAVIEARRGSPELTRDLRGLHILTAIALLAWTGLVGGSHFWIAHEDHKQTLELAANAARANFNKDLAFRLWATRHGGVYVPPDERTPPNPYLDHIPDRDVVTEDGQNLTLMNPAYMLRQTMAEYGDLFGVKGRITSLKPLNPNNAPDDWERAALKAFETGVPEISEVSHVEGEPYFRLIKPMVTEVGCLKCHAHQGYTVGDIRGGIGVSVPMKPFLRAETSNLHSHSMVHGVIWVLGLGAIGATTGWRRREALRRYQVLAALGESEERFRTIFEQAAVGVALIDSRSGRFLRINGRYAELLGYDIDELAEMDFQQVTHPEDLQADLDNMERLRRGDIREFTMEKRYFHRDGSVVWVELTVSPTWKPGEQPTRHIAIVEDITARKKAAEALQRHLEDQRLTAEIGQIALQPISLDDMLEQTLDRVLANEDLGLVAMGCIFLIDENTGDLVMRVHRGFAPPQCKACARLPVGTCLCGKAAQTGETVFAAHVDEAHEKTYEGMEPHGHYCVPITAGGQVLGVLNVYVEDGHRPTGDEERFLGIVTDTLANGLQRRQAEERLQITVDELTRTNVELERFATVAAHDLQEPVRNVLSYAQRLEKSLGDRLDGDESEFFSYVLGGATRIRLLVSDLQAYTQVTSHAQPYRQVDTGKVLEVVQASLRDTIAETASTLDIDEMPSVIADEAQLSMLFQHLIGNAIKFRRDEEPPQIRISATQDDGNWLFAVTDNGIGIDQTYSQRIFEVFRRLHTSTAYPGTGVGLALCKQIVERHGGRIWVESEEGSGSTFYFTLPSTPQTSQVG